MKLDFVKTSSACPEQYKVFLGSKQVGYVRLRWGFLKVIFPNVSGDEIYSHDFEEKYKGEFKTENERKKYIKIIENKIKQKLKGGNN